ncbi:hypothetical protein VNI00_012969 [Paramarasmius palmivorus]|uniref:Uncharacterized protein n=1 Tax=Paramarasmius palmivorus TaxID=297713 RepID=A0AAW0C0D8_9AGAR
MGYGGYGPEPHDLNDAYESHTTPPRQYGPAPQRDAYPDNYDPRHNPQHQSYRDDRQQLPPRDSYDNQGYGPQLHSPHYAQYYNPQLPHPPQLAPPSGASSPAPLPHMISVPLDMEHGPPNQYPQQGPPPQQDAHPDNHDPWPNPQRQRNVTSEKRPISLQIWQFLGAKSEIFRRSQTASAPSEPRNPDGEVTGHRPSESIEIPQYRDDHQQLPPHDSYDDRSYGPQLHPPHYDQYYNLQSSRPHYYPQFAPPSGALSPARLSHIYRDDRGHGSQPPLPHYDRYYNAQSPHPHYYPQFALPWGAPRLATLPYMSSALAAMVQGLPNQYPQQAPRSHTSTSQSPPSKNPFHKQAAEPVADKEVYEDEAGDGANAGGSRSGMPWALLFGRSHFETEQVAEGKDRRHIKLTKGGTREIVGSESKSQPDSKNATADPSEWGMFAEWPGWNVDNQDFETNPNEDKEHPDIDSSAPKEDIEVFIAGNSDGGLLDVDLTVVKAGDNANEARDHLDIDSSAPAESTEVFVTENLEECLEVDLVANTEDDTNEGIVTRYEGEFGEEVCAEDHHQTSKSYQTA